MIRAAKQGKPIYAGAEHEKYGHTTKLADHTRTSLVSDFD
jgi:hypothetical protein